ncbi:hypothetical protein FO440_15140 [Mucilaginibacter corticis]|uniref:Uncharacterized protein n=1 Tax=Mucilaginibacter corticis TaxID=2597670 RepID=A0A556MMM1_9SPHI|nr:hypothetical protein [Mucilaginibacter corticis]TSJ41062.1 hypothetical protein FO440_15140 [Mucilaginibacter corticis]
MGKQHDTFPNEQPEVPVPKETPEINRPSDPNPAEIPEEDPQIVPDELPDKNGTIEGPDETKVI